MTSPARSWSPHQGRAYVIRNEYVSSSYWNCDATSGKPICYQTKKMFVAQPAKK